VGRSAVHSEAAAGAAATAKAAATMVLKWPLIHFRGEHPGRWFEAFARKSHYPTISRPLLQHAC